MFKVISISEEVENFNDSDLENLKVSSGKDAGICYQKDSYFNSSVSDPEKARPRFSRVASTGHHSIADHAQIKVYMENISKMLAIVLNSLQMYNTSEKSGRYTEMTGNSADEKRLYDKWRGLFRKRILEIKPDIDDDALFNLMKKKGHDDVIIKNGVLSNGNMSDNDEVHQDVLAKCKTDTSLPSVKFAQENARYILSVFTRSTCMSYTTSLRQWNYIYDWGTKYIDSYKREGSSFIDIRTGRQSTYFEEQLYNDLVDLTSFIKENLYVEELRDNKDRYFEFLAGLSGHQHPMDDYDLSVFEDDAVSSSFSKDDVLGVTYSVAYQASFVHIAQAERHRTLKYFMRFNPSPLAFRFYVPKMIVGTDLEVEWLSDLESVKDIVPQATLIGVVETGFIGDFILKCKERLCGRAQLEIMEQTKITANRFIEKYKSNYDVSDTFKRYVDILLNDKGELKTKGALNGSCLEGCIWGCSDGLNRLF